MGADENEFIRQRQLQEREQQQQQQQKQPKLKSDGEVEDDGDATEVNYGRSIIVVLAECQSQVLRPVKEGL